MIELRSEGVSARIDPSRGARLHSLTVQDADIVAQLDPPEGHLEPHFDGMFPMAPFASTLDGTHLEWEGHKLPLGDGRTSRDHGTVADRPWDVLDATESWARFGCTLGSRWPLSGRVEVEYALRRSELTAVLTLHADDRMPAVLGFHPWFSSEVGDAELTLELDSPVVHGWTPEQGWVPLNGEPPHPWDAVLALQNAPVLRWGPLELRLDSPQARYWIVCETFSGGVCVEPLDGMPGRWRSRDTLPAGSSRSLELRLSWSSVSDRRHDSESDTRDRASR